MDLLNRFVLTFSTISPLRVSLFFRWVTTLLWWCWCGFLLLLQLLLLWLLPFWWCFELPLLFPFDGCVPFVCDKWYKSSPFWLFFWLFFSSKMADDSGEPGNDGGIGGGFGGDCVPFESFSIEIGCNSNVHPFKMLLAWILFNFMESVSSSVMFVCSNDIICLLCIWMGWTVGSEWLRFPWHTCNERS